MFHVNRLNALLAWLSRFMPRGLRIGHPHHYTAVVGTGAYSLSGQDATLTYTPASDTTPNAFSFTDQTGVALSTVITSAPVTISGLSVGVSITLNASGGTIDKNGNANFLGSQIVANGDTVRARVTSSSSNSTATNCTVVASPSGVQDMFTVTTAASTGGSLTNGSLYSGVSNVSATMPNYEWFGGVGGVIESGTLGAEFTRTGWTKLFLGMHLADWHWSNVRTLSGTKSMIFDALANGEGSGSVARGTYDYDTGAAGYGEMYTSGNYYWQVSPNQTVIQWKQRRWTCFHDSSGEPVVGDNTFNPTAYTAVPANNDDHFLNTFYNGGATSSTLYFAPAAAPTTPHNTWIRIETWWKENSAPGVADGQFRERVTRCSDGAVLWTATTNNRLYRNTGDVSNPFRYAVNQNYFGNGLRFNGNDWENSVLYFDDLVHQWTTPGTSGGQRRFELWNAATPTKQPAWLECTARSGTSFTVRLNIPANWGVSSAAGCYIKEYDASNNLVTTIGPL